MKIVKNWNFSLKIRKNRRMSAITASVQTCTVNVNTARLEKKS